MTSRDRTLQLDKENAKWLGVCAGIANFLDVKPWTVRLVCLGSLFFGTWPLVPAYFLVWYLLDNQKPGGHIRDTLLDNQAVKHFRSVDFRKKLYRDTQNAKVGGVCAGIADYLEMDVSIVRVVFLMLAVMGFGFPVPFYIAAMFILDKKPQEPYRWNRKRRMAPDGGRRAAAQGGADTQSGNPQQDAAARTGGSSRHSWYDEEPPLRDQYSARREFQYCARKFASLQQRLARIEAWVTSPKFRLHNEFRNMQ